MRGLPQSLRGVALQVAKPAQWEFKSQPDLSSPHALWGWSATLVVRVEALSPELSIPPQKKKTEKTEKCQSCFYYSCHAVELITSKMSLQKHSLKINPPHITKKNVETSFTLN
jgi:hypothetical protein